MVLKRIKKQEFIHALAALYKPQTCGRTDVMDQASSLLTAPVEGEIITANPRHSLVRRVCNNACWRKAHLQTDLEGWREKREKAKEDVFLVYLTGEERAQAENEDERQ